MDTRSPNNKAEIQLYPDFEPFDVLQVKRYEGPNAGEWVGSHVLNTKGKALKALCMLKGVHHKVKNVRDCYRIVGINPTNGQWCVKVESVGFGTVK